MQAQSENLLTRSQALSKIKREVGFPSPSPSSLSLYFDLVRGDSLDDSETIYYKIVADLTAIGYELREKNLIRKWFTVKDRNDSDAEKNEVFSAIKEVVSKHQFDQSKKS